MGYCISITKSDFTIKHENKEKAFNAILKLMGRAVPNWKNIFDAMDAWRYPVSADGDGCDITKITFRGEKFGDEEHLFNSIAPFVEEGSFIEFLGEDGARWKIVFDGEECDHISQEEEVEQLIEDARREGYNEALKVAENFCLARREQLEDWIAKNEADKCAFGIRKMKKVKQ